MPFGYEETRLWQESLADRDSDRYSDARARLRVAYHNVRERAVLLAAEIPQDLREFTVHDATHLDALWEMADIITGPHITLSPSEAFVLGGAFLIHDLGLGLAAWPGGLAELADEADWRDILAACIGDSIGRPATAEEIANPSDACLKKAKEVALREKHAARGAQLALIEWRATGSNNTYHLIQDENLRTTYGVLIGEIAASHWLSVEQLPVNFPNAQLGAAVDCPDDWTVDPLKLACILRLADIAHIDSRRAPGFLRTIRRPSELADRHWIFQGHIQRPRREDDRLIYTGAPPFEENDAQAWWLCFDTLQAIDHELHAVDSLLADQSRSRLAARSVKGADSPFRLRSLIPTTGWEPVDAHVKITNVPSLAQKLGGQSLYGDQPSMALRELIQNAADATRALEVLTGQAAQPVKVTLRQEDERWFLEVEDSGIGMSQQTIVGPLLDFGRTYWGSDLMRAELPGLASSPFRPAARFGIGFYSVFMLGSEIKVTTNRYGAGASAAHVLEFKSGLNDRPILRQPRRGEQVPSPGTIVSVRLDIDPMGEDGLLERPDADDFPFTLPELCWSLVPGSPVDLIAIGPGGTEERCIAANDWLTIEPAEFVRRVSESSRLWPRAYMPLDQVAAAMRVIEQDGEIVGRAAIAPSPPAIRLSDGNVIQPSGILAANGLRVETIGGVVGVFTGFVTRADRESGLIHANAGAVKEWASEQAQIWKDELNVHRGEWTMTVSLLAFLGARMDDIDICCCRDGYLTGTQLAGWATSRDEILVLDYPIDIRETPSGLEFWDFLDHKIIDLPDNALIIDNSGAYGSRAQWGDEFPDKTWRPARGVSRYGDEPNARVWWYYRQRELEGTVIDYVLQAWGCKLVELIDAMKYNGVADAVLGEGIDEILMHPGAVGWALYRPIVPASA